MIMMIVEMLIIWFSECFDRDFGPKPKGFLIEMIAMEVIYVEK